MIVWKWKDTEYDKVYFIGIKIDKRIEAINILWKTCRLKSKKRDLDELEILKSYHLKFLREKTSTGMHKQCEVPEKQYSTMRKRGRGENWDRKGQRKKKMGEKKCSKEAVKTGFLGLEYVIYN